MVRARFAALSQLLGRVPFFPGLEPGVPAGAPQACQDFGAYDSGAGCYAFRRVLSESLNKSPRGVAWDMCPSGQMCYLSKLFGGNQDVVVSCIGCCGQPDYKNEVSGRTLLELVESARLLYGIMPGRREPGNEVNTAVADPVIAAKKQGEREWLDGVARYVIKCFGARYVVVRLSEGAEERHESKNIIHASSVEQSSLDMFDSLLRGFADSLAFSQAVDEEYFVKRGYPVPSLDGCGGFCCSFQGTEFTEFFPLVSEDGPLGVVLAVFANRDELVRAGEFGLRDYLQTVADTIPHMRQADVGPSFADVLVRLYDGSRGLMGTRTIREVSEVTVDLCWRVAGFDKVVILEYDSEYADLRVGAASGVTADELEKLKATRFTVECIANMVSDEWTKGVPEFCRDHDCRSGCAMSKIFANSRFLLVRIGNGTDLFAVGVAVLPHSASHFTDLDMWTVHALSVSVAGAYERAGAMTRLDEGLRTQMACRGVAEQLAGIYDIPQLMAEIARCLRTFFPSMKAGVTVDCDFFESPICRMANGGPKMIHRAFVK